MSASEPVDPEESTSAIDGLATSCSLLERARSNDTDAWKRIVNLYGPLVNHWCVQASISRDQTEDVVQDIFLSVARQLRRFRYDRPRDSFRGWLRVIAQRRISDYFRRISDRPRAEGGTTAFRRIKQLPDPLVDESLAGKLPADDPDAESEEIDVIFRAMELIRPDFEPKTWTAFWRTVVDAVTPADVAVELSMSAPAVRMAKSRVLSRLRRELDGLVVLKIDNAPTS